MELTAAARRRGAESWYAMVRGAAAESRGLVREVPENSGGARSAGPGWSKERRQQRSLSGQCFQKTQKMIMWGGRKEKKMKTEKKFFVEGTISRPVKVRCLEILLSQKQGIQTQFGVILGRFKNPSKNKGQKIVLIDTKKSRYERLSSAVLKWIWVSQANVLRATTPGKTGPF